MLLSSHQCPWELGASFIRHSEGRVREMWWRLSGLGRHHPHAWFELKISGGGSQGREGDVKITYFLSVSFVRSPLAYKFRGHLALGRFLSGFWGPQNARGCFRVESWSKAGGKSWSHGWCSAGDEILYSSHILDIVRWEQLKFTIVCE